MAAKDQEIKEVAGADDMEVEVDEVEVLTLAYVTDAVKQVISIEIVQRNNTTTTHATRQSQCVQSSCIILRLFFPLSGPGHHLRISADKMSGNPSIVGMDVGLSQHELR
jgi:hypothetical protein